MDGVTDAAMRHSFATSRDGKPDVIFTEQISVEAVTQAFNEIADRLTYTKAERPVVVQLSGYNPSRYYPAAKEVIGLGFDGIDINLGCPVKAFNKKGGRRGAGLIGQYEIVGKIIHNVREAINESGKNVPLSVKTRTGVRKPNTEEWINFLSKLPIDAITLHGRTFKQGYSGKADWKEIARGAQITHAQNKVFLGNGDVTSREEGNGLCRKHSTDGVLIGRAARGNPWAFSKDPAPMIRITAAERRGGCIDTLLTHARYFEKVRGKRPFLEFRKHIGWYLKGFPGAKSIRAGLIAVKTLKELEGGLARYA